MIQHNNLTYYSLWLIHLKGLCVENSSSLKLIVLSNQLKKVMPGLHIISMLLC